MRASGTSPPRSIELPVSQKQPGNQVLVADDRGAQKQPPARMATSTCGAAGVEHFSSCFSVSFSLRPKTLRLHRAVATSTVQSIDPKALLHGKALVPDVNVVRGQFG